MWRLVTATGTPSAGASPARMFELATRLPAVGTGATPIDRAIVTCRDGATRLGAQWNTEIGRAGTIFGRRLFPGSRTDALARAELLAALPAAHDFLIGASRSAGEIMRQQMVLNAVHDAGEQWAAEAGNAAALRSYTEARAEAQTVSAYRAIGRQAETWVPLLRIVFECLYIGAFPMAVLLMLTPAGTAIFRSYVTGLVWLQSWGPLYAILHRISMGEAAERMGVAALMPGGDVGISLVAQAGIRAVAADVAVMSGYLSMSVPFLAAALAYGLSKATVLATSVLAVGQDAASSAAHEGTTGNLSLANTSTDTHRFATLEGRQIRTSAHVDTDRYTGYAPAGAAFTVTGDGTAVADMGAATSRIPAAGVRLSESLATSHEARAAEARGLSRHWSSEAGQARNAAVTDATALVERYSHDVSTGEAHARGVTESESASVQSLESHMDKLAEIAGITKNQAAALTGEARVGGGWDFIVRAGADGSAVWRGQTIESDDWNRMKDYAEQHQVSELFSSVSEASRRYSTATGESELASLDESLGANLTRMRRFEERASLSRSESESWTEQAAEVRADARAIDRELGQPFFAWLAERPGTDGRPIGAAGAMRLASPQTPEDAEELRGHAANFIAERFPAPAGPDPATISGEAEYEAARDGLADAYTRETGAAHAGWAEGVRDRAYVAGAPIPGEVEAGALGERSETRAEMAGERAREGRARTAVEVERPFEEHATENLPPGAASFEQDLERAISLANEERYAEARDALDPLLEHDSMHPWARLLDGILLAREGRVGEAIEIFDRLRRDHPDMSEPWNNLAVLQAAEGRLEDARETLLAALGRRPSAIGYANLGDVYSSLAERAYVRSRELGGDSGAVPAPGAGRTVALSVPGGPSALARTERPPAEEGSAPMPGASAASATREPACVRSGAFEDRSALADTLNWLESRGARVLEVHREDVRRVSTHQVYLPPLKDRSTAEESLREIRSRGVHDVAVIRGGPLANGISFGVFGVPENMRRRVAALVRLGYAALSRDNATTVPGYAVEARAGEDPDGLLAAWAERFPERSLVRVDCG